MQPVPFVLLNVEGATSIVLAGFDGAGPLGFDPVRLSLFEMDLADVRAVVSVEPAAVFAGIDLGWAEEVVPRMAANRAPRFAARGARFALLPPEAVSGFPTASVKLRRHRMTTPTVDAVRVSALFAVSTVRTTIAQAEEQFDCFGALYRARGRQMPDVERLRDCFVGLQNSKTAIFRAVAAYAPTLREVIAAGYRDRALRRVLTLEAPPPDGLGLAKLSFTLALLGQDTICLDGRLLGVMFPRAADRAHFERTISKRAGRISAKALAAYEAAEDAFLADNLHYDPKDPIGRARAQWLSWESVGGKGAEHRVWLNLLAA